jgi:hypothetical protein
MVLKGGDEDIWENTGDDSDVLTDLIDKRYEAEDAIAASITDAISSHTDGRWSSYIIDGYHDLCSELQKVYKPESLGYDHTDLKYLECNSVELRKD